MDELRVTIVGQDIFKEVVECFDRSGLTGLTVVNEVRNGMLGNLKTLTYAFQIPAQEVIEKRKALMNELAKDSLRLIPMYVHGDWMRIFVLKTFRT